MLVASLFGLFSAVEILCRNESLMLYLDQCICLVQRETSFTVIGSAWLLIAEKCLSKKVIGCNLASPV